MAAKAVDRRVTGRPGKAGRGARRGASEQGAEAEEVARPPYGQVTEEYQREKAKELVQFFREQRLQELSRDSQVFGWTPVNEIGNGRWVMFGLLVGLLTEYATAVNVVEQIKLTLSVFSIVDLSE